MERAIPVKPGLADPVFGLLASGMLAFTAQAFTTARDGQNRGDPAPQDDGS